MALGPDMTASTSHGAFNRLVSLLRNTGLDRLLMLALCVIAWAPLSRTDEPFRSSRSGAIRFVQITDVHIFDAGKRLTGLDICQEQSDNLAAFQWAIKRTDAINEQSNI